MKAKILSLNIGEPAEMEWQGKSILSSMKKSSVPGPLVVHQDRIENNTFANSKFHGSIDNVLYAYGLSSAAEFMKAMGGGEYIPGSTGETLTLSDFDESEVSAGDVFQIGEVLAQATFPRIPCGKVNFRMQNANGQKAMQECGKSGVYFQVLKPGIIKKTDMVERIERSKFPVSIAAIYRKLVRGEKFSPEERRQAEANGAIPERIMAKLI